MEVLFFAAKKQKSDPFVNASIVCMFIYTENPFIVVDVLANLSHLSSTFNNQLEDDVSA
jgi:hypothetical protein